MVELVPVERKISIREEINIIKKRLVEGTKSIKGKIIKEDSNYIEITFGSLLKSRLIGEFWVSKNTLPKKAKIEFKSDSSRTEINIIVVHTHKYGVMWGYTETYQKALEETVEKIADLIQNL